MWVFGSGLHGASFKRKVFKIKAVTCEPLNLSHVLLRSRNIIVRYRYQSVAMHLRNSTILEDLFCGMLARHTLFRAEAQRYQAGENDPAFLKDGRVVK